MPVIKNQLTLDTHFTDLTTYVFHQSITLGTTVFLSSFLAGFLSRDPARLDLASIKLSGSL